MLHLIMLHQTKTVIPYGLNAVVLTLTELHAVVKVLANLLTNGTPNVNNLINLKINYSIII